MNNKKSKKIIIIALVVFAILICVFIFGNSLLSLNKSNNLSFRAMHVVEFLFPWVKKIYWMKLHGLVRKAAHVLEFMALGVTFA